MLLRSKIFNEFNYELKSLWESFDASSDSYAFQSYEWQNYWNQKVGQPKYNLALFIIVCFIDDEVHAIFPLGIKKTMGARVLEFLGSGESDYSVPILKTNLEANSFSHIWDNVLKLLPPHDIVYFRNIPKLINNGKNHLLKNINVKLSGSSHSAKLPDTVEDYFSTLSQRMLKDNRRMRKKLSEMGDLKFVRLNKPNEFSETLETLIEQKISRYMSSNVRNIFSDNIIKNFYLNIHELLHRGFGIHLSALMLDDEILATHLGIWHLDRFYYLMPTFNQDPKWNKFSLGRLHLEELIRWSIENRISTFDFTIGSENYKNIWCDSDMAIYKYLKVKSWRGIIYYACELIFEFIKANPYLKTKVIKVSNLVRTRTIFVRKN